MESNVFIENFLKENKGYLKSSPIKISYALERKYPDLIFNLDDIASIRRKLRKKSENKNVNKKNNKLLSELKRIASEAGYNVVPKEANSTPILKKKAYKKLPKQFVGGDTNNVLIIGDIHEPFSLDGYLEFCREQQEKYNCGRVIFIGDVIDNHYSSYHESDPDGFSAGQELDRAIYKISEWYKVFPHATVIIGNHDRMAYRKAQTSGLSKKWVRKYNEVLNTPTWKFVEEVTIGNINYNHGEGGTARTRMKNEMQSQVQGHLHNQFYIEYNVSPNSRIFGMQVGCGVDRHAYAMAYGKHFKKPAIGCGVVLNNEMPILIPMDI